MIDANTKSKRYMEWISIKDRLPDLYESIKIFRNVG